MVHLPEIIEAANMGVDNNTSLLKYFIEPEIQQIEHELMETYQEMRNSSNPAALQARLEFLANRNAALLHCKKEIQYTIVTFKEILGCCDVPIDTPHKDVL